MIAGGWMYTLKAKEIKLGYPAKSKQNQTLSEIKCFFAIVPLVIKTLRLRSENM